MDLSIDPGSPHLRTTTPRPPTVSEWDLLKPSISYAYIKKQHPARLILKGLSDRGYHIRQIGIYLINGLENLMHLQ